MPKVNTSEASRKASVTGNLFVALAAFGFSAKAILVKLAYLHQVDAVTLLAMRMPRLKLIAKSPNGNPRITSLPGILSVLSRQPY